MHSALSVALKVHDLVAIALYYTALNHKGSWTHADRPSGSPEGAIVIARTPPSDETFLIALDGHVIFPNSLRLFLPLRVLFAQAHVVVVGGVTCVVKRGTPNPKDDFEAAQSYSVLASGGTQ